MDVELKKHDIEPEVNAETINVAIDLACVEEKRIAEACATFYNFAKTFIPTLATAEVIPRAQGKITTLRTPCGNGYKTWSRYKIFVYLRKFNVTATHSQLEKIVEFLKNLPRIEIQLSIQN